jgi:hypothetical protein
MDAYIKARRDEGRAIKELIAAKSEEVGRARDLSPAQRRLLNNKLMYAEACVNACLFSL